jgi:hypothetical protein
MNRSGLIATLAAVAGIPAALLTVAACSRTTSVQPQTPAAGPASQAGPVFPRVQGRNLLKQDLVLPDDLAGSPTLVHVAFYQQQQLQVNTWLGRNEAFTDAIDGLRIIETPTMKRGWAVIAGQIDNWMRSGIEGDEARGRTISLFVDTDKFRDALDLPTDQTNYVLLLDEAGRVLHREEGIFDEDKLGRLVAAAQARPAANAG